MQRGSFKKKLHGQKVNIKDGLADKKATGNAAEVILESASLLFLVKDRRLYVT